MLGCVGFTFSIFFFFGGGGGGSAEASSVVHANTNRMACDLTPGKDQQQAKQGVAAVGDMLCHNIIKYVTV